MIKEKAITNAFKSLDWDAKHQVSKLDLSNLNLKNYNLTQIKQHLEPIQKETVLYLNLENNNFDDDSIPFFREILKNNQGVRISHLNLNFNRLTEKGTPVLREAFFSHWALRVVMFANQVDGSELSALERKEIENEILQRAQMWDINREKEHEELESIKEARRYVMREYEKKLGGIESKTKVIEDSAELALPQFNSALDFLNRYLNGEIYHVLWRWIFLFLREESRPNQVVMYQDKILTLKKQFGISEDDPRLVSQLGDLIDLANSLFEWSKSTSTLHKKMLQFASKLKTIILPGAYEAIIGQCSDQKPEDSEQKEEKEHKRSDSRLIAAELHPEFLELSRALQAKENELQAQKKDFEAKREDREKILKEESAAKDREREAKEREREAKANEQMQALREELEAMKKEQEAKEKIFKEELATKEKEREAKEKEREAKEKEREAKEREREAEAKEREKIFKEELATKEKEREAKEREREAKAEERIKVLVEAIAKQQSQKSSKKKKRRKKTEIPNIVSDSVEAKMVSAAVPLPATVPAEAVKSAPLPLLGQNNQILFSIPRPPLLDSPAALVQKSADAGQEFRP